MKREEITKIQGMKKKKNKHETFDKKKKQRRIGKKIRSGLYLEMHDHSNTRELYLMLFFLWVHILIKRIVRNLDGWVWDVRAYNEEYDSIVDASHVESCRPLVGIESLLLEAVQFV